MPDRDGRNTPTRRQLGNGDVTRSRKLEGAWWAGAGAYVVASYSWASDQGGAEAHDGQVWFYDPLGSTLTLRLAFGRDTAPVGNS